MPNPTAQEAAAYFLANIPGVPYGTGPGEEDCSGAWTHFFAQYGLSVYHGSNTQYRQYLAQKGTLQYSSQLEVGMAVFKRRYDGEEPSQFQNDGIGNVYHVGCVASISPLKIVHATDPVGKIDTTFSTSWNLWGKFKNLEFTLPADEIVLWQGKVNVTDGETLNLRIDKVAGSTVITTIPDNTIIDVNAVYTGWLKVTYETGGTVYKGYVVSSFVEELSTEPENPIPDGYGIYIPMGGTQAEVQTQLTLLKAMFATAYVIGDIIAP